MSAENRPKAPRRGTADPARRAAFEVLHALRRGNSWEASWARADRGLAGADRSMARADRGGTGRALDRRFAQELASGTVRLRGRLDHVLAQHLQRGPAALQADVLDVLRLGAYQLLETDRVAEYSAVHATVELAKDVCPHAVTLVNAVLRALQRSRAALQFPDFATAPVQHLVHAGSHPEWLAQRWVERFGADAARRLCDYDNRRPALCLRVNRRRLAVTDLVAAIPGSVRGRWAQDSVRCPDASYARVRGPVQRGDASVQDESATLVVEEADPQAGERWIDLAAAPGGKACHLAERVGDAGHVVAVDTTAAKVARIHANAARLGLPQVIVARGDARHVQLPVADGVLLDAPCTGLGVLGRRPDARWRKRPEDPERLGALQGALLAAAANLVRPGGVLVYSVCSFEPEETMAVAEAFAARHPQFVYESGPAAAELRERPGILYLLPQCHGVDGGFVARWRRTV